MKESRFENILHHRRKSETQKFNPFGEMTTQDAASIGLDRGQSTFLRGIMGGMKKGCAAFNRSKSE